MRILIDINLSNIQQYLYTISQVYENIQIKKQGSISNIK